MCVSCCHPHCVLIGADLSDHLVEGSTALDLPKESKPLTLGVVVDIMGIDCVMLVRPLRNTQVRLCSIHTAWQ